MGYNDWDDEYEDDLFSAYGIDDIDEFDEDVNMEIYDNEFQDEELIEGEE